jgi:hypothetical protein
MGINFQWVMLAGLALCFSVEAINYQCDVRISQERDDGKLFSAKTSASRAIRRGNGHSEAEIAIKKENLGVYSTTTGSRALTVADFAGTDLEGEFTLTLTIRHIFGFPNPMPATAAQGNVFGQPMITGLGGAGGAIGGFDSVPKEAQLTSKLMLGSLGDRNSPIEITTKNTGHYGMPVKIDSSVAIPQRADKLGPLDLTVECSPFI